MRGCGKVYTWHPLADESGTFPWINPELVASLL